jgi:two-component system LytT family response regulator
MTLRAVIIDDEQAQRSLLTSKLKDIYEEQVIIVGEAFSVDSAIREIERCQPELIFLDIDIIGGSGFDVLDAFTEPAFSVIFVTSYPEFGAQAFRYQAIDYILKPIDPDNLREAVQRVLTANSLKADDEKISASLQNILKPDSRNSLYKLQADTIPLVMDRSVKIIKAAHIVYCKAEGNYTDFFFTDGSHTLLTQQLGSLEEKLLRAGFIRIHRSYIVNSRFVSEIIPKAKQCSLILSYEHSTNTTIELEVSSYYRTALLNYYQ